MVIHTPLAAGELAQLRERSLEVGAQPQRPAMIPQLGTNNTRSTMTVTFRYTKEELLDMTRRQIEREEQLEIDSMWLISHLDQLSQARHAIKQGDLEFGLTLLDQQRVAVNKAALTLQKQEQYDETPSRESVYP